MDEICELYNLKSCDLIFITAFFLTRALSNIKAINKIIYNYLMLSKKFSNSIWKKRKKSEDQSIQKISQTNEVVEDKKLKKEDNYLLRCYFK